jgi:geranylgeranyl reductase
VTDPVKTYDAVVVGGGPAGATAAQRIAEAGASVLLIDKPGRIKPCGGAVPPKLIRAYNIPDSQIVARTQGARILAPSGLEVDMPIGEGYVGMVDREHFDEFLRERAASAGAERRNGTFETLERDAQGAAIIVFSPTETPD